MLKNRDRTSAGFHSHSGSAAPGWVQYEVHSGALPSPGTSSRLCRSLAVTRRAVVFGTSVELSRTLQIRW